MRPATMANQSPPYQPPTPESEGHIEHVESENNINLNTKLIEDHTGPVWKD